MTIATVGLLHPGAMGAAVGKVLTQAGRTVLWASEGRSAESGARAREAGLQDAGTVAGAGGPQRPRPGHLPAARRARRRARRSAPSPVSTSTPTRSRRPPPRRSARSCEAAGARYVDGAIIGPPPDGSNAPRLYLSGADAPAVAELFAGGALEALVLDGEPTAASALKMAYAGWTKGTAALLLTMREAARAHGVEDALVREWEHSIPSLPERSAQAARQADEKGWRWVAEMREIAATLGAADLPTGFHEAAAEVFERRAALERRDRPVEGARPTFGARGAEPASDGAIERLAATIRRRPWPVSPPSSPSPRARSPTRAPRAACAARARCPASSTAATTTRALRRRRARAASRARRARRRGRARAGRRGHPGGAQGRPAPPGARAHDARRLPAGEPQRRHPLGRDPGARRRRGAPRAPSRAACSST